MYCRKSLLFVLSMFIFVSESYSQASARKKYSIEYGMVENTKSGGSSKFYFIDYGNKFRNESFDNTGALKFTEVYDGINLYSIQGNKIDTLGQVRNQYLHSADPAGYKKNKRFKTLPPKTIAGIQCTGFEYYNTVINQMITIYGWNNIIMLYNTGDNISEAVKFDPEKPSVSFTLVK